MWSGGDQKTDSGIGLDGHWDVEPDVGRTLDGFSGWLDRNRHLIIQSHKRIMAYVISCEGAISVDATKKRTEETMRDLRNRFNPQGFQWEAGGLVGFSSQEVLFAYLCKHTESTAYEAWLQLSSKKALEEELRSVRTRQELAGSSCGSGYVKQHSGKHTNSLQALSRLLAHDSRQAWMDYCRPHASPVLSEWGPGWESDCVRVADGVSGRLDRLRGLGNAVVPQVAEWIGRRIVEAQPGGGADPEFRPRLVVATPPLYTRG